MYNQNERALLGSQLPESMLNAPYLKTETMRKIKVNEDDSTEKLAAALSKVRSELLNKKKNLLIEQIKKTIVDLVYYSEKQIKMNCSDYLSQILNYRYTYMAGLFAKVHGTTIQQFIIATKIERAKELLIYEGLTLTEIAYKMHYSSVAHLSNQFKKVTGLTPSKYLSSLAAQEPQTKLQASDNSSKEENVVLSLIPPQAPTNGEEYSWMKEG